MKMQSDFSTILSAHHKNSKLNKPDNFFHGDINILDSTKSNMLFYAVKWDDMNFAKYLIERGIDVNFKNQNGSNSLIFLDKCKQPGVFLDFLIRNGLNVNNRDMYNRTILVYFIMWPNINVVRELLRYNIEDIVFAVRYAKSVLSEGRNEKELKVIIPMLNEVELKNARRCGWSYYFCSECC